MKVITKYPVYINRSAVSHESTYLSANGAMAKNLAGIAEKTKGVEPPPAEKKKRASAGEVWDKAKGTWVKAKESGLLDKIGGLFGLGQGGQQPVETGGGAVTTPPPPAEKKGLSTGAKIGIAVGVLAVIGGIVYFATRNKGK